MSPGFDRFVEQARLAGGIVPVTRQVVLDGDTPVTAFTKLHRGRWGFLLESLEGGERWARYTFLATEPREVFRYRGRECARWTPGDQWRVVETDLPPLEHLGRTMRRHPPVVVPGLPRFTGGAVGFWGYDVVRTIESLPDAPPDDRDLPDAIVMVADTLLVLDNLFNRATVIASVEVPPAAEEDELHRLYAGAEARIERWLERLASPGTMRPLDIVGDPPLPQAGSPYPDERFQQDVRRIKEYIAAGDTFQTVLSRRIDVAAPDPFLSYRYLRALNPAPYLYYLHCDDIHVIGSSPEILVRVEDGEVTVRPIAGTRPRGADAAQDVALADELTADPKERAEHLMLVDLGRNDVGRVAEFGSVRLTALHDDRAVLARDAPGERGPGTAPARARRGRRAGGLLSGGNGVGGAQGACDADHRRAGAGPAGSLRRGGGLRRLGRAHARHRHRHPHLCHPRRPGVGAGGGGNRR